MLNLRVRCSDVYNKNFNAPAVKEGFLEVKKITFVPVFKTEREKTLFAQRS